MSFLTASQTNVWESYSTFFLTGLRAERYDTLHQKVFSDTWKSLSDQAVTIHSVPAQTSDTKGPLPSLCPPSIPMCCCSWSPHMGPGAVSGAGSALQPQLGSWLCSLAPAGLLALLSSPSWAPGSVPLGHLSHRAQTWPWVQPRPPGMCWGHLQTLLGSLLLPGVMEMCPHVPRGCSVWQQQDGVKVPRDREGTKHQAHPVPWEVSTEEIQGGEKTSATISGRKLCVEGESTTNHRCRNAHGILQRVTAGKLLRRQLQHC